LHKNFESAQIRCHPVKWISVSQSFAFKAIACGFNLGLVRSEEIEHPDATARVGREIAKIWPTWA